MTNYKIAKNITIIKFANPSTLDKFLSVLSYLTKISTIIKSLSVNKFISLAKTIQIN